MDRLTTSRKWEDARKDLKNELGYSHIWKRLNAIEDILGDDYDLGRLRELVEADRDERVVVLPVKPGGKVRPKQRPYREPEIVDCVTIYAGGRITYGFHQIGMRNEWVDRWEEEESVAYIPDTCSAELKGGQNG